MRLLNGLSAVCLLTCIAIAQDVAPEKRTIPLLIQDSHHQPAINITRESLAIKQHKTAVTNFSLLPAGDLSLRIGILIDVSNSERGIGLQYLTGAATDFAKSVLRTSEDQVFFGAFATKLEMTPWLDRQSLGLGQLTADIKVSGGTALYDAVEKACERMSDDDQKKPTRRVLVVISDGEDNQSHVTLERAAREAARSGTVIFGFSVNLTPIHTRGNKVMETLAELTGGEALMSYAREAPKTFTKISELMRGLYFLSYVPASAMPKEQDIEIKSAMKEKIYFSWPKTQMVRHTASN